MTLKVLICSLALVGVLVVQFTSGKNRLVEAVVALIEQTFVRRVNSLNVYIKCKEDPLRVRYFSDVTNSVLRGLDGVPIRIGWQRELPIDDGRHFCVFGVDSLESLKELCNQLLTRHYNIDGNTLIILRTFTSGYYDVIMEIFQENLKMGIVNANIVVEPLPGMVLMFTYFPFSKYACYSVQPVLVNEFRDSKWLRGDLFPLKLSDLHGCTLICAAWEDFPYLKILRGNDGEETYDGIEGRLLEFISAQMNFKIQFYFISEEEIDATLDEKGLIFGELFEKNVAFVVGSFHYKPVKKEDTFAPSGSYYLSRICIVLSSRREEFPPHIKLMMPFTLCLWLLVLTYFSVSVLVSFAANRMPQDMRNFILGTGNDAPVYNIFYIAIGGGVSRVPRRNFARYLLFVWLFQCLVLRSAYQSALFHFIRGMITKPLPDSIEDVLRAEYEILLTLPTLQYTPFLRGAANLLNGSEVESFPMLAREQRKIAIVTPYEYFGYFRKVNREQNDDYYISREKLFTQQLSIYMPKSSFLLDQFNARIVEYIAVGLQDKWERSVIDLRWQGAKKETSTLTDVNMKDILGAIEIFFVGSVASLIMFLVEILSFRFCQVA